MTRQRLEIILGLLSLAAWGMLLWFMNSVYPTNWAPLAFLAIVAVVTFLTMIPLSLWITYHWGTSRGMRNDLMRALRHGAFIGILVAGLLGLKILALLTLPSALLLVAVIITAEIIAQLKTA